MELFTDRNVFFFKQKTAYEIKECDWSSDVCSSDLKKGRYVQGGILHQLVSLDFDQILFDREITLIGSRTQKPSAWIKALKLMRQERVDLKSLVTDKLPLTQWEEGFRRARQRSSIKVLLYP